MRAARRMMFCALVAAIGCGRSSFDALDQRARDGDLPAVALASPGNLHGHWLRIEYADTYTAEAWWSFAGFFRETNRRESAIDPSSITRIGDGTFSANRRGEVNLRWIDIHGDERLELFTGAIISGASPAPTLQIPEYLSGHERLVVSDRRLTTGAYSLEDGTYLREDGFRIERTDGSSLFRQASIRLRFTETLFRIAAGASCMVEVSIAAQTEASDQRLEGSELFTLGCTVKETEVETWKALSFDSLGDGRWWRFLEESGARSRHPNAVYEVLSGAFTHELHFDVSQPNVLIDPDASGWHYGMMVDPPAPDAD